MRTAILLIVGVIVGVTATLLYWQWENRKLAAIHLGLVRMTSDSIIMLGIQASDALENGSPEGTRDFTNYVIDSARLRAKAVAQDEATKSTYGDLLEDKLSKIPAERRSLSPSAPKVFHSARQTLDAPNVNPTP